METCPHGARLVISDEGVVSLLSDCPACEELLANHPGQRVPRMDRREPALAA